MTPLEWTLSAALVVAAIIIAVLFYSYSKRCPCTQGFANKVRESVESKTPSPTLVLFWSKTCGHCTAMKPAWEEAKKGLKNINILDIEASDPSFTAFGVQGVPMIRLYPYGPSPQAKYIAYEGDRSVKSIIDFGTFGH